MKILILLFICTTLINCSNNNKNLKHSAPEAESNFENDRSEIKTISKATRDKKILFSDFNILMKIQKDSHCTIQVNKECSYYYPDSKAFITILFKSPDLINHIIETQKKRFIVSQIYRIKSNNEFLITFFNDGHKETFIKFQESGDKLTYKVISQEDMKGMDNYIKGRNGANRVANKFMRNFLHNLSKSYELILKMKTSNHLLSNLQLGETDLTHIVSLKNKNTNEVDTYLKFNFKEKTQEVFKKID